MRWLTIIGSAFVLGAGTACGGGEAEQPAEAPPSHAEEVAAALELYDPAAFDTVAWEAPEDAMTRGSVVFSYSCRKCHGTQGYGDGGFVLDGDTLYPPSFHEPDWRYRDDIEGLRQQIFVGTEGGMPHWGPEGLKPRDVDAVARFIQARLIER
jgi:mono/diheme cytochrome c family protein